tara:strand:- start:411 stop:1250 length:840 start_codon:yes stop_codon:yes gene_type:complete
MFGHTFYFSTIKKYVTLFGTLFNDIHITRTNSSNVTVALLKIPLAYAAKEKVLARVDADPNIDRQAAIVLPRMSFEMTDMRYDSSRKLNTIGRSVVKDADSTSKLKYQYNPVPYNLSFRLYVYVKNAEDGTKIVEQILPFFTPDWTTTVQLIPEMGINMDIPVVLESINIEDTYDGDFDKRRVLIWTLDFTLKGYIYGPVKKSGIIKFANTNFYIPQVEDGQLASAVGITTPSERITVRPGLLANGSPTSNATSSIPLSEIEANDDFGYCVSIESIITE